METVAEALLQRRVPPGGSEKCEVGPVRWGRAEVENPCCCTNTGNPSSPATITAHPPAISSSLRGCGSSSLGASTSA